MPVMTVLGPLDGDQLGVTLMHEHLLIDVSYKFQPPSEVTLRALSEQPITLGEIGLGEPMYVAGHTGDEMHPHEQKARVTALVELVKRGYVERLPVSHDVCTKMQLRAFGGWGYAHLSRHIEPRLRKAGLTNEQIATIRVDNPRRLLDVQEDRPR